LNFLPFAKGMARSARSFTGDRSGRPTHRVRDVRGFLYRRGASVRLLPKLGCLPAARPCSSHKPGEPFGDLGVVPTSEMAKPFAQDLVAPP